MSAGADTQAERHGDLGIEPSTLIAALQQSALLADRLVEQEIRTATATNTNCA